MKLDPLKNPADFARVLRTGRRARRDGVTAYVLPQADPRPSRLGLAIRARRAVDRNKVRRRLRAAWRGFDAPAGFDVAVRADESAASLTYQELEAHFYGALGAAGLRQAP